MSNNESDLKACTKCNELKPLSRFVFRKDTGKLRSNCMDCTNTANKRRYENGHKDYHASYRARNREKVKNYLRNYKLVNEVVLKKKRREAYARAKENGTLRYMRERLVEPGKANAREAVKYALLKDRLIRSEICEIPGCGNLSNIEAHHDTYLLRDRLTVRFLCSYCHASFHSLFLVDNLLLNEEDMLGQYEKTPETLSVLEKAMLAFPKQPDKFSSAMERDVFSSVQRYLKNLNGNFVRCEYGQITNKLFGLAVIRKRREFSKEDREEAIRLFRHDFLTANVLDLINS